MMQKYMESSCLEIEEMNHPVYRSYVKKVEKAKREVNRAIAYLIGSLKERKEELLLELEEFQKAFNTNWSDSDFRKSLSACDCNHRYHVPEVKFDHNEFELAEILTQFGSVEGLFPEKIKGPLSCPLIIQPPRKTEVDPKSAGSVEVQSDVESSPELIEVDSCFSLEVQVIPSPSSKSYCSTVDDFEILDHPDVANSFEENSLSNLQAIQSSKSDSYPVHHFDPLKKSVALDTLSNMPSTVKDSESWRELFFQNHHCPHPFDANSDLTLDEFWKLWSPRNYPSPLSPAFAIKDQSSRYNPMNLETITRLCTHIREARILGVASSALSPNTLIKYSFAKYLRHNEPGRWLTA